MSKKDLTIIFEEMKEISNIIEEDKEKEYTLSCCGIKGIVDDLNRDIQN